MINYSYVCKGRTSLTLCSLSRIFYSSAR